MRSVAAILACAIAGIVVIAAPQAPSTFASATASMRQAVENRAAPSIVAAAGRDGRLIWSDAVGVTDRGRRRAATPQTRYLVASLTKPFVATAVMILSERRQISLDEPITRYLEPITRPGVTNADAVTVRRTLGNVAGFPVHYQYFYEDEPAQPASFAQTMACYGAELQPAGTSYTYSNLGFEVLRRAVEHVSQRNLQDFLAREVFTPLKLEQTVFMDRPDPAVDAAVRHGTNGEPIPAYVTDHGGASNLYASVEDLVRFGLFHVGAPMPGQRDILTPASRSAMQQPGLGGYGLGWSVNDWGRRVVWHSGAMPGSSAALWTVPAEKVAVAVIANQIGAPVNQIAAEILQAMLGPGPSANTTQPPNEAPGAGSAPPSTPDLRGRWQGTLSTCPKVQTATIDVGDQNDVTFTLNGATADRVQSASTINGRLTGSIVSTRTGVPTYRFNLRLEGERLVGIVTRTTSHGPRGNSLVSLWANLTR